MKRLILLATLSLSGVAIADPGVQQVLACMRANQPPSLSIQRVELTATDRTGASRTLQGRLMLMREKTAGGDALSRAALRVDQPDYLAGASYLVRESRDHSSDEMYVYLPSVGRVRRVAGSLANGSLLGTNFSYYDFKQMQTAFGAANSVLSASGELNQRPVYVLTLTAAPAEGSPYSSIRTWVDQKTCVPLQAEFYEGKTVRKRLVTKPTALYQAGNYWYPAETDMTDLSDGTHTVLRILGASGSNELPGRYFDPQMFYQAN